MSKIYLSLLSIVVVNKSRICLAQKKKMVPVLCCFSPSTVFISLYFFSLALTEGSKQQQQPGEERRVGGLRSRGIDTEKKQQTQQS